MSASGVRAAGQRWLATMGLDDQTIALRQELRRRIAEQRAACGPRPPWWRFGARRQWERQLAGAEQRAIEQMRMDVHCQLLAMGSGE